MSNPVTTAVRKLRKALNESQQDFAYRLNTAIRTVARYESSRAPKGKVLSQMEKIARTHGFDEIAAVFQSALEAELGEFTPSSDDENYLRIAILNDEEPMLVRAFLRDLRGGSVPSSLVPLLSRSARAMQKENEQNEVFVNRLGALYRRSFAGDTPQQISTSLGMDVSQVVQMLQVFAGPVSWLEREGRNPQPGHLRAALDELLQIVRRVLALLSEGLSPEDIASRLLLQEALTPEQIASINKLARNFRPAK